MIAKMTATGFEPGTTYLVKKHSIIYTNHLALAKWRLLTNLVVVGSNPVVAT